MTEQTKSKEELTIELHELHQKYNSLKEISDKALTELRQLEEALKEADWKFRALFEKGPIGVAYHVMVNDTFGNPKDYFFLDANDTYRELTGVDPRGKLVTEAFPGIENDPFDWIGTFGKVARTGETISFEQYLQPNQRWYNCVGYQYKPDHFVAAFVEITQRKQAEEALRNSEISYKDLIDGMNETVWVIDFNGNLIDVNNTAIEVLGYSKEELLNIGIYGIDSSLKQEDIKALVSAMPSDKVQIFETSHKAKDGKTFPVEVQSSLVTYQGKRAILSIVRNISERKLSEETKQKLEEEQRFSIYGLNTAQALARMGSWKWDIKNDKVTWSDEMYHIFGIDKDSYKGVLRNVIKSVIHPGDLHIVLPENASEFARNEINEYRIILPDNSIRHIQAKAGQTEFDTEGKPIYFSGIAQDITERKQLETVHTFLSTSGYPGSNENFFESLTKYLAEILDSEYVCIDKLEEDGLTAQSVAIFNKGNFETNVSFTITQTPYSEVVGKTICCFPENVCLLFPHDKALQDLKAHSFIGTTLWSFEGKPIGLIALIGQKPMKNTAFAENVLKLVAIRAAGELERMQAEEALKQLSARLSLAVRAGGVGIWDYDIVQDILLWDDQMFALYGIDKNDFGGVFEAWKSGFHPKDVARVDAELQMAMRGKKEFDTVFRVVWPDGSIHTIRALGSVQRNVDEQPVRMIGTNWDITDQMKAEMELILAKEQAEESDRLKSAFLANMSHEIRTPMNGILGFSNLLKEPGLTGDQQQEYIRIIEKSGARMLNIINDIVDISKIEAGLMKLESKETNINEQIEYIYSFFKPEMESKGLKLFIHNPLPTKEATITTDREKVYAILTNLVKNAIKYTEKGKIEIGYDKKDEYLEFYVRDTGIGIPKDRQVAIFQRFVQADIEDRKALQGAGLGLAITKSYVEMCGGKIWVDSEEGIGSTFYFTLPYNAEQQEKNMIGNSGLSASGNHDNPTVSGLKILIAEDDEASEMLMTIAVKAFSEEILIVKAGAEAVEICHENPDIDLILMDIQMPQMGGYEATQKIRLFNKNVIIVAQTAFALAGDREKAIAAGCNDYLPKPINKNALHALIQKYFGK